MADAILVKTICDLSHTLRLRTVAEGIETIGQLKYLRQVGCEEAQGYLFSQPVMAEEFARLVGTARIPDGGILVEPCPNETPDPHTVTGFPGTP